MNKFYTISAYFHKSDSSNKSNVELRNSDSTKKHDEQLPSQDVVRFLLRFSASLESKKGFSYQLN